METVYIYRFAEDDCGTQGILCAHGFFCKTLELPWRNNQKGKSCIPPGNYKCVVRQSPSKGMVYHLYGVKDRSNILIHLGNWAGDADKGLKSDVAGCILLGQHFDIIE